MRCQLIFAAVTIGASANAQFTENFEAPTSAETLIECATSSIHPWEAFATMPLTNGNLIRLLQRNSAGGSGFTSAASGCAPDSYDSDPLNENYARFAFKDVNGSGDLGLMREICPAIGPTCQFDLSYHWTQRTSCGSTPVTGATGTIEVRVGSLIDCEPDLLNTTLVHSQPFTITNATNNAAFGSWSEVTASFSPTTAFNRFFIVIRIGSMPAGSYSNIFIDDVSFQAQDEQCAVCCDPQCPYDLNCDGGINEADLVLFSEHFFGNTIEAVCDTCHEELDLDQNGLFNILDLNAMESQIGSNCYECCNIDCPADFDCNTVVNDNDLLLFMAVFQVPTENISPECMQLADFNSDGFVNINDLLVFMQYFGAPCESGLIKNPGGRVPSDIRSNSSPISVQQNPSSGVFKLTHGSSVDGPLDVMVFDHTGRIVTRLSGSGSGTATIDITEQSAGTYMAVINYNGSLSTIQLVKE